MLGQLHVNLLANTFLSIYQFLGCVSYVFFRSSWKCRIIRARYKRDALATLRSSTIWHITDTGPTLKMNWPMIRFNSAALILWPFRVNQTLYEGFIHRTVLNVDIYSKEKQGHQKLIAEKRAKWPGSCRVSSTYDDFIRSATARFACPLSEIVRTRRDFVDPAEMKAVFHALPAERRWDERQNGRFFIAKNKGGQFTPETPTALCFVTKQNAIV